MDFAILGLLFWKNMSLYDLKVGFAQSLGMFYQASLGSLQTTLKKLLIEGRIEIAQQEIGRRKKRTYRITERGRAYFFAQFATDLPSSRLEETALLRVFFLGLVPQKERAPILEALIARVKFELETLEFQAMDYGSAELGSPQYFPLRTLDYGIQAHRQALTWFQNLKDRISSQDS